MKLSNKTIYLYGIQLSKAQNEDGLIDFNNIPVVINFFIQKNIREIIEAATLIENTKNFILKKYGKINPDNTDEIKIDQNYINDAQKDLDDLMEIEQDINIHPIKLSSLKDSQITTKQLQLIFFMIEDDISSQ